MVNAHFTTLLLLLFVPVPSCRAVITRICQDQLSPTVRILATQKGLSLSELSRNIGYEGVSGLLDAINGRSDIPLSRLLLLAAELGVHSIEELFGQSSSGRALETLRQPRSSTE